MVFWKDRRLSFWFAGIECYTEKQHVFVYTYTLMDIPEESKEYFAAQAEEAKKHSRHYYGDIVRRVFLGSGDLILLLAPFFLDRASFSLYYVLGTASLFIVIAGVASPAYRFTSLLNMFSSFAAIIALECFAQSEYVNPAHIELQNAFGFWLAHLLALGFAIAFYFSVKTARWEFLRRRIKE